MSNIVTLEVQLGVGASNKTDAAKKVRVLTENVQAIITPQTINYTDLTTQEKATFDAFIALLESKVA